MSGYFAATPGGAVYEQDMDRCDCAGGEIGYSAHEFHCGKYLVGFLPIEEYEVDPDLLPSALWDFSAVDYPAGPHIGTYR